MGKSVPLGKALHLKEVRDMCRRQRVSLLYERERLRLSRELRSVETHLRLRKSLYKATVREIEEVVRPLVESVD